MSYKYNPPAPTSPNVTRRALEQEFRRWNAQAGTIVVPDFDLPMYRPGEPAAVVRFDLRGQRIEMRIDRWPDFNTNLRCAYLNIRDMRLAEARGGLGGMRDALLALPAGLRKKDPWEVLGLRPDAGPEDIEAMYRAKAKRLHPDAGGSAEAFKELQEAYEEVRKG